LFATLGAYVYKLSRYLAGIVVGRFLHHVKNSIEFIHNFGSIRVGPEDLMISFDVVSLFTRVPIMEFFKLLKYTLVKTSWFYIFMSSLLHISPSM